MLRAVIFDYGKVLSAHPDVDAHSDLVAATGLEDSVFEDHYWAHRHAYDRGDLDTRAYWQKIADEAGFPLDDATLTAIVSHDCRMWGNLNEPMVAWARQLIATGMRVAILSNMGEATRDDLLARYPWLHTFHHLTWSCELRVAKPEPEIYLHTLRKLDVTAEEALFIDDLERNIEAARSLGIHAIQFHDVAQLNRELLASGLATGLPLPVAD